MVVDEQRRHGTVGGLVVVEALEALEGAPPEVGAPCCVAPVGGDRAVDLLEVALADVADPEVAGAARSNENRHGLRRPYAQMAGSAAGSSTKGLSAGTVNGFAAGGHGVDAQDLAEPAREVEGMSFGVAARAAVADTDVEQLVGPERELAAVVVAVRLVDR